MTPVYSNNKFKVIRQLDSMQCGIASLAMVCSYYGKNISIKKLSSICPVSSEGVSMLAIKAAAESIGLEVIAGRIHINELIRINGPFILY